MRRGHVVVGRDFEPGITFESIAYVSNVELFVGVGVIRASAHEGDRIISSVCVRRAHHVFACASPGVARVLSSS